MSVTPSQFELLGKSLEFATINHQVISNNLANVNTPGYRAKQMDFQTKMRDELERSNPDLKSLSVDIKDNLSMPLMIDGNNVDIDAEVTNLEKNTLLYSTYSQLLATKISLMKSAITGQST